MSEERRQFSLRRLFLWVTVAACLMGDVAFLRAMVQKARYAAGQSAYGGQRMTREQAREIRPNDQLIDWLPDSEFLREPREAR